MQKSKKILIIRLSSIGDIFHTFTILPDLKRVIPEVEIDWLVDASFSNIVTLSPDVNNVISIPLRKWKKNKLTWFFKILKFRKETKLKNYDYIIDTQGLIKSAFLARLLFSGKIYGLDFSSAREGLSSYFYNYKYKVDQNNKAVIRLRGLISKIFDLTDDLNDFNFRIDVDNNYQLTSPNGYIVLLHGTSRANKKWSLDNWVELSKWLLDNYDKLIVLTYSNEEELLFAREFINKLNNQRVILIDKLQFNQLSALIKNSSMVIGVDTGFTHLANLLKIPTIAIYLHSDPGYVGIMESDIAYNLGGINEYVSSQEVIDCILDNKLNILTNLNFGL